MPKSTRALRSEVIILKRSDFGEADRLLTVLTPSHGKLRALAKGARKPTARKSGHVELFMLTDMLIAHGRTWDIISQAEVVESYRDLREDLDKTSHAYYLAELMDRFTEEHDPNQPLFELLALTLARLSHVDDPVPVVHETHALQLAREVRDVARDQLHRVNALLEGEVLRVYPEGIEADGFEDVVTLELLEAAVYVGAGEGVDIAHM